jgi:hypothetical protein
VGILQDDHGEALNGFWVEDWGEGIPGEDEKIAGLFSINRALRSTKHLRRVPSRGALGNGLRVVAGAVLASGGSITVSTCGRTLLLTPDDTSGRTYPERIGTYKRPGTLIKVLLGDSLPVTDETLHWARQALDLAMCGGRYKGKPAPHWYDSDSFHELLRNSGAKTVREVVLDLEGCSGRAGNIAEPFKNRCAASLTRPEAEQLLGAAREAVGKTVKPSRLGCMGKVVPGLPSSYAKVMGNLVVRPTRGTIEAEIPYVVEAWAEESDSPSAMAFVNRTPITADLEAFHQKKQEGGKRAVGLIGCGLSAYIADTARPVRLAVSIITPYMPIISDGKTPDFSRFGGKILEAAEPVVRRARRVAAKTRPSGKECLKDLILKNLEAEAQRASDNGRLRFSIRQLFYGIRPHVLAAFNEEPRYGYFSKVVAAYESRHGEIKGMYRDNRGTIYHPHTGEEIPLGTLNVETYKRPAWMFNKILYCEKEGFFPILRAARWPERHDCVLMTSKGFATRAVRDVFDLLGETDKELLFFCIHDADAYGTMIYQALDRATKSRPERKARVINLGLDPEEALEMGLMPEPVKRKNGKAAPVADYVPEKWRQWLQHSRVELNAMPSSQFLGWLDTQFEKYDEKVVPPTEVISDQLGQDVRSVLDQRITEEILRDAGRDEQVETAFNHVLPEIVRRGATAEGEIRERLREQPDEHWSQPVGRIAKQIVGSNGQA